MSLTKIANLLSLIICLVLLIIPYWPPITSQTQNQHTKVTLYVDRSFDEYGQDKIIKAAMEWTEATHHIIEYTVVRLPTTEKVNISNSIFVAKVSPDFPEIIWRDYIGGNSTLGLYFGKGPLKSILLVVDRLDEDTYKTVMLHELGHSLGLEHSKINDFGTLMYPYIDMGANTITERDLVEFCKLYGCNVNDLKN